MALIGVDFTSSPSRRKPIVLAAGRLLGARLRLDGLQRFDTLGAFGDWLAAPGEWVGGFDLPFGLPRALVQALGWPSDWAACMAHYAALPRADIRRAFDAFRSARPAGNKYAHRATDGPAGSSAPMKLVNPPVGWMLHAGVPLLIHSGASLPAQRHPGDARRVALEAYPGLLARRLIGRRSYKSDSRATQTDARLIARKDIVHALELGHGGLDLRLQATPAQADALVADAQGDALDAVLCLAQAAWATQQPDWGLPETLDPLEGWILSA